jgi:hypothetical protein
VNTALLTAQQALGNATEALRVANQALAYAKDNVNRSPMESFNLSMLAIAFSIVALFLRA